MYFVFCCDLTKVICIM